MVGRTSWPAEKFDDVAAAIAAWDGGMGLSRTADGGWRAEMSGGDPEIDASDRYFEGTETTAVVTLPGRPTSHNADTVEAGCAETVFRWDVDIYRSPPTLFAATDGADTCGDAGFPTAAIAVLAACGAAVAAVAVAAGAAARRRHTLRSL